MNCRELPIMNHTTAALARLPVVAQIYTRKVAEVRCVNPRLPDVFLYLQACDARHRIIRDSQRVAENMNFEAGRISNNELFVANFQGLLDPNGMLMTVNLAMHAQEGDEVVERFDNLGRYLSSDRKFQTLKRSVTKAMRVLQELTLNPEGDGPIVRRVIAEEKRSNPNQGELRNQLELATYWLSAEPAEQHKAVTLVREFSVKNLAEGLLVGTSKTNPHILGFKKLARECDEVLGILNPRVPKSERFEIDSLIKS